MVGRLCRTRQMQHMAEELRTLADQAKRTDVKECLRGEAERLERVAARMHMRQFGEIKNPIFKNVGRP